MKENQTPGDMAGKTFSSHTSMTWNYYRLLHKTVKQVQGSSDPDFIREQTFVAHLIAITAIETFFNAYFQVLVEEGDRFLEHKTKFYKDFNSPYFGISKQIKQWPKLFLGKEYDVNDPAINNFERLVSLRNHLTHFKSTYNTISLPGVSIGGLADTTEFQELSKETAQETFKAVIDIVKYVFMAKGVSDTKIPWAIFQWTGIHPIELGYEV